MWEIIKGRNESKRFYIIYKLQGQPVLNKIKYKPSLMAHIKNTATALCLVALVMMSTTLLSCHAGTSVCLSIFLFILVYDMSTPLYMYFKLIQASRFIRAYTAIPQRV